MDGYVVIGTKLDTKSFDAQIDYVESQLQEIEDKLKQADMGFEVGDTQKLEAQYEKLSQKLTTLRQKQMDFNRTDLTKAQKSIENIGNSTSSVIKKVGKWALAIFSVRSAYMLVRRAVSTLSQYNEDLANKIQSIQLILASALEPIINRLVNLVYKLLYYLNYITKSWFNIDLFSSANEKALNKGAKSAEKMKKSLAGFDEMNIMQDTTISSSGTSGVSIPSMEDVEIPSWIKWIADNKDIVIAGLLGIAGAIGLIKLSRLIGGLGELWKIIKPLFMFIGANAQIIGGIILIIGGLAIAIKGIIGYLKDPTWENFGTMLLGIGIIASGVLLIFGGFPALITLIVGAVVALGVAIYKNWDKIKEWTLELVSKIKEFFGGAIDWVKDKFNSMITFFSDLISKIVGLFKTIGTKVGDAIGSAFKIVINGVLKAIENILNFPIKSINKLLDVINAVPGINIKTLPTFSLPRLAVGGIVNMPGRGVPVDGAITGEAGREGVIPLTDSQAMETLGATIGKYININLTNITKLDNRQIAKEQKKINAQNDFAFNR